MTRPEVAALHRALREQRAADDYVGEIEGPNGAFVDLNGTFDLAPLVDAVLAAHADTYIAERERSIRAGARRASKRFKP